MEPQTQASRPGGRLAVGLLSFGKGQSMTPIGIEDVLYEPVPLVGWKPLPFSRTQRVCPGRPFASAQRNRCVGLERRSAHKRHSPEVCLEQVERRLQDHEADAPRAPPATSFRQQTPHRNDLSPIVIHAVCCASSWGMRLSRPTAALFVHRMKFKRACCEDNLSTIAVSGPLLLLNHRTGGLCMCRSCHSGDFSTVRLLCRHRNAKRQERNQSPYPSRCPNPLHAIRSY